MVKSTLHFCCNANPLHWSKWAVAIQHRQWIETEGIGLRGIGREVCVEASTHRSRPALARVSRGAEHQLGSMLVAKGKKAAATEFHHQ